MALPLHEVRKTTKAALVMLLMGEDAASEVFRRLDAEDIRSLNKGMARVGAIGETDQDEVLLEYLNLCQRSDPSLFRDSDEYLRQLVHSTMGEKEAERLLQALAHDNQMRLAALEPVDARTLSNLVSKEHPQTIALIMAYIDPSKAAKVLANLPVETQVEVCLRMASLDTVSPQTLRDVESALMTEMKGLVISSEDELSGVELVAEILNSIEKAHEERIFEQLLEIDPELAEEIRNNMFVFDDLVNVEAKGIQALLKELDNSTLLLALKTASDRVKTHVLSNLSSRAVEMLEEDMEVMGPTRLSDVEGAQQEIAQIALRLESEGKLAIAKAGGEDEFV